MSLNCQLSLEVKLRIYNYSDVYESAVNLRVDYVVMSG